MFVTNEFGSQILMIIALNVDWGHNRWALPRCCKCVKNYLKNIGEGVL
jgi:hypothetical protein